MRLIAFNNLELIADSSNQIFINHNSFKLRIGE